MAETHPNAIPYRVKDLTGQVFERWTVLGFRGTDKRRIAIWLCRCNCGTESIVSGANLKTGRSTGCRHCGGIGVITHGMSESPEFTSWRAMIERCTNPNHKQYDDYGGRGIRVCKRWAESFQAFFDDMGPRPNGCSLDRHPDHDGSYAPDNCRWATAKQQARNTRRNRYLTFNSETKLLIEWAEHVGISEKTLRTRLRDGWSVERALVTPVRGSR